MFCPENVFYSMFLIQKYVIWKVCQLIAQVPEGLDQLTCWFFSLFILVPFMLWDKLTNTPEHISDFVIIVTCSNQPSIQPNHPSLQCMEKSDV